MIEGIHCSMKLLKSMIDARKFLMNKNPLEKTALCRL